MMKEIVEFQSFETELNVEIPVCWPLENAIESVISQYDIHSLKRAIQVIKFHFIVRPQHTNTQMIANKTLVDRQKLKPH